MRDSRGDGGSEEPLVLYHGMCPNCGGPVTSDRLRDGLPCHVCLPEGSRLRAASLRVVLNELNREGRLVKLRDAFNHLMKYDEFSELFRKATGTSMWGAQRFWAKRLLKGKSFAIVAPTGSGKTTFGLVASIYVASKGGRVLMVFPTSTLAYQVYKRALAYRDSAAINVKVITYNGLLSERDKSDVLNIIKSGDFNILIITNAFLPKGMDILSKYRFDLVFVDDVDSVMKASSRNIERLLLLLGVPREAIDKALEIAKISDFKERESKVSELRRILEGKRIGSLIVSGMLTRTRRTARAALFREILGFDVGGRAEGLRNVVDLYVKPKGDPKAIILDLVKRLGDGGIIYVPTDLGREFAEELSRFLNDNGINAGLYLKPKRKLIEGFEDGSIPVLIGLATSRSALVRGIDLPHRIRYVVFAGVPKIRFKLSLKEFNPGRYIMLLSSLRVIAPSEYKVRIDKAVSSLRNIMNMSQDRINKVIEAVEKGESLQGFDKYASEVISNAIKLAQELLNRDDVRDAMSKSIVNIQRVGDDVYVILPDSPAYIQGSGRTSRMYLGGITHGLSVLVVDNEAAFNSLSRDLRYRLVDFQFINYEEFNVAEMLKTINEERELIRQIMAGNVPPSISQIDPLKSVLVIVESPTKARTIANFFGKPSTRVLGNLIVYEVTSGNLLLNIIATKGHVVELATEQYTQTISGDMDYVTKFISNVTKNYYSILKIDGNFIPIYSTIKRCPTCGRSFTDDIAKCPFDNTPLVDSSSVIEMLRDLATEVDLVLIGTDPDSEGEKIAWDVFNMLKPFVQDIRRIEFHEVTKRAILNALANPRGINGNMVKAQLVRRIEDRWIGFGLSSYLQRAFNDKNMSAGRVQTPVLKWIIERYIEYRRNRVIRLIVRKRISDGKVVEVSFDKVTNGDDTAKVRHDLRDVAKDKKGLRLIITKLGESEEEVNPPPPFTTDSMLTEATARLRAGTEEVMRLAQELFEMGLITYHRTDSTRVSAVGISVAKDYITNRFGEGNFMAREWGAGEEGAHECIRPTRPIDAEELRSLIDSGVLRLKLTSRHIMLYDLIFRRFIASQMQSGLVKRMKVEVKLMRNGDMLSSRVDEFVTGITRNGFLAIYPTVRVVQFPESSMELPVTEDDEVIVKTVHTTYPYREGDIVAEMKRRRIGRPSTYAKIIETLKRRGYVKALGSTKVLIPTKRGVTAYICLSNDKDVAKLYLSTRRNKVQENTEFEGLMKQCNVNFKCLISEDRTRMVEEHMDNIENGDEDYLTVLHELFNEAVKYGIMPHG
ncbi:reverse gyrase [Caldivirga sp.]|uniref:reverse gyrase n=1 Tax=Caldivirga sp. TaxID=2080243 RepID=UPI0025C640D4|nr:reverse gyrase [Caldivirga sp.]